MKKLFEYKHCVLYGGGVMADRLFKQLKDYDMEIVAVVDNYSSDLREIRQWNGYSIYNLSEIVNIIEDDTCVVLAINAFFSIKAIEYYGQVFSEDYNKLFVPNPYTCLRPCVMNDEFAAEKRIPVDYPIYEEVRKLFTDNISEEIYDRLWKSKTYDSQYDSFELVNFNDIKDMYYFGEAYWDTYSFEPSSEKYATIFDCGAYIGDSIKQICSCIPEDNIIYYAFEPDHDNANKIECNDEFKKICNELIILEYGVGAQNKDLFFEFPSNDQKDAGRFVESSTNKNAQRLTIRRIDDLNLEIKGQLYIKMDIEGTEMSALEGAQEIIKKYSPFLAICVYHRKNDIIQIPSFINKLGCKYKYYLRGGFHTILWAIPYR